MIDHSDSSLFEVPAEGHPFVGCDLAKIPGCGSTLLIQLLQNGNVVATDLLETGDAFTVQER
jgi:hypothetical protein